MTDWRLATPADGPLYAQINRSFLPVPIQIEGSVKLRARDIEPHTNRRFVVAYDARGMGYVLWRDANGFQYIEEVELAL